MRSFSSRHRPAAGLAAALIAIAALVGCAPTNSTQPTDSKDTSTASGSLLPAGEGTTKYPLTLTTPWGKTVLKERPERIVAIGTTDAELLAAIGVTPVATQDTLERAVWTQRALPQKIEKVYEWATISGDLPYEDVAASKPDLIIWNSDDLSSDYEKLSAIAPVLAAETAKQAEGHDWRTEIQAVGKALDLTKAAKTATAEYDEFFKQARADNPEFKGLTMSYVVYYGGDYGTMYASSAGSINERLFLDLGFTPNPLAEQFVKEENVSEELVSQIDADVLIVGDVMTPEDTTVEKLLTGTERFKQLNAFKTGHWVVTHGNDEGSGYFFDGVEHEGNVAWALAHGGALIGKQWAAEQMIPLLRSALDLK